MVLTHAGNLVLVACQPPVLNTQTRKAFSFGLTETLICIGPAGRF